MRCLSLGLLSLPLALVVAAACSDGDADPGPHGSAGAGGAAAPFDHPFCDVYLDCASVAAPAEFSALLTSYGPEGTCWQGDSALAEQCETACRGALGALRALAPGEPRCGGSAGYACERCACDTCAIALDGCSAATNCASMHTCLENLDAACDGLRTCWTDQCLPGCPAGFVPYCSREICDNGADDDTNNHIDCADYNCTYHMACFESCDNGVDDNGNGFVDCDDWFCDAACP